MWLIMPGFENTVYRKDSCLSTPPTVLQFKGRLKIEAYRYKNDHIVFLDC